MMTRLEIFPPNQKSIDPIVRPKPTDIPKLPYYVLKLNFAVSGFSENDTLTTFRDPASFSAMSEFYAAQLYGFEKFGRNKPLHDGVFPNGFNVSIKQMKK